MKYVRIGVTFYDENNKVIAKKLLEDKWNFEKENLQSIDERLKTLFNKNVEDEVSEIMVKKIIQELNSEEIIKWMHDFIKSLAKQ